MQQHSLHNYSSPFLIPYSSPLITPSRSHQNQSAHNISRKGNDKARCIWSRCQKQTYARVLLSYLMNNVQPNQCFVQHIAHALHKTPQQVYAFHRHMLAQFKNSKTAVTHLLRKRATPPHQRIQQNGPYLIHNAQQQYLQNEDNQVQMLYEEREYMQNRMIQASLDSYEQRQEEQVEVHELQDEYCFEGQGSTNGSFNEEQEYYQ